MPRPLASLLVVLLLPLLARAQHPTQTVRGTVFDRDTRAPLPGVTVVVQGTDPVVGTVTDADGRFRLDRVPVGRHRLAFSSLGYEPHLIAGVLVGAGREVVLEVPLREQPLQADEVVVTPGADGDAPLNAMALTSARRLSVEQAARFAGAMDDPARLAAAFAGASAGLGTNAIVIRGNAPRGLQWRLDGIEIPTPSHFANLLTFGGGGITALSSQMLADSDFYTGAFPAQYGNALSGVFDLRLRSGHPERHEHALRAGTIGLDAGSEGPLGGGATYLFNYRYSTFALLGPLLPEDAGGIAYQNAAFKVQAPAGRATTLSAFGIGATDRSGQAAVEDPAARVYPRDAEAIESPTRFGALALQARTLLSPRAFVTASLSASGNGLRWALDEATAAGRHPRERVRSETGRLAAVVHAGYKAGPRATFEAGATLGRLGYRQHIQQAPGAAGPLETRVDAQGHTTLAQGFVQARLEAGPRLSATVGLHGQHFALTGEATLEPRAALAWRPRGPETVTLAYGRHTQTELVHLYFAHLQNRRLRMTQADHLVLGYSRALGQGLRVKAEGYVQRLAHVPVAAGTSFSVLNLEQDWFVRQPLVSTGAGRNVGLDLTVERDLRGGWYVLLAGSAGRSRYRGGDGRWRSTRYDRRVVSSLLAGREWTLPGRTSVRRVSLNGRLNAMGGRPYTAVDTARSHAAGDVVYDEMRAFSQREPPVFFADLSAEYRTDRRGRTHVWSLQLLNATAYREFYGHRYNRVRRRIEDDREAIVLPNLSYRIEL